MKNLKRFLLSLVCAAAMASGCEIESKASAGAALAFEVNGQSHAIKSVVMQTMGDRFGSVMFFGDEVAPADAQAYVEGKKGLVVLVPVMPKDGKWTGKSEPPMWSYQLKGGDKMAPAASAKKSIELTSVEADAIAGTIELEGGGAKLKGAFRGVRAK